MESQTIRRSANNQENRNSKLQKFFVDQLKDIYWAEQKLVKTLPKLRDASTSHSLKNAFENHLQETKMHVSRLEQVFSIAGEEKDSVKCQAMAGIVDEGEDIIDETDEGSSQRDVGLIFAGQKAEHYEIASYGGLIQLADTLGYTEATSLLKETLDEEKKADELLTSLAESGINKRALQEMYRN
ncbi:MAG TPA: ferritin-like domain-containing protein [Puia sp.]